MTIKYEPVFGDHSLFDNAPEDAEMVTDARTFYKFTDTKIFFYTDIGALNEWEVVRDLGARPAAQRRVIKTPTWTRADKEAGLLPPVGVKARNPNNFNLEGRIAAVNRCECCFVYDDGSMELLKTDDISPIETPEEKAKRLENEFVSSLLSEDRRGALSMIHAGYTHGVIDAYRRIKAEGFKND